LTYSADISGRRKPRFFVKVTLFVMAALIVLLAFALWQQAQERGAMAETLPVLIDPVPTATLEPTPTPELCPSDPKKWNFVPGTSSSPGDVMKRIEPACVYAGFNRAVAWILAIQNGYSRAEATQALALNAPPTQSDLGILKIQISSGTYLSALDLIPLQPDYTEWQIGVKGEASTYFTLQGCYRAIDVVVNEVRDWNPGYPVICTFFEDVEAVNTVMRLGDNMYSSPLKNATRYQVYLGYASKSSQWLWLGSDVNLYQVLDKDTLEKDRNNFGSAYGGVVWDAAWLKSIYGLDLKPLPDGWIVANSNASLQKILSELSSYKP
jgi:hypothetical protein